MYNFIESVVLYAATFASVLIAVFISIPLGLGVGLTIDGLVYLVGRYVDRRS